MLRPYKYLPTLPPSLVNKRPQQLPAAPVEGLRPAKVIEVPSQVADQEPAMRQRARPIIEPRLERARTLPRLDPPAPDLDFLIDLQHPRDLEHEPRHRERPLQRRARAWTELGGITYERKLLLVRIPQRQVPGGLRPG